MITNNGLTTINKFLAGIGGDWAGTIAIGALGTDSTTASTTDLQYEIGRYKVNLKSYKPATASSQIIIKASLPPELIASVYEIGIFPSSDTNNFYVDHQIFSNFSETTSGSSSWYIGTSPATTSNDSRVGSYNISLGPAQTASISNLSYVNSSFIENDYLSLLYYVSSSISAGNITVTLKDASSPANTWTASGAISATASGNWKVLSMSLATKPNEFSNISSASISTTSASGTIKLDCLKFVKNYTKPTELKLLSRTSSSTAFVSKTYGQSVELEYYLQVN